MKNRLLEKFIRYVKIDTRSSESSVKFPSTENQFDLARLLVDELKELGLRDAAVDNHCYVTATLGGNTDRNCPVIALFAHLDTSPEVSGKNVSPQIIEKYDGGDIVLDDKRNIIIREGENPCLKECIGHTIVTTDGTTLLGSDDKAGISAIMTMLEHLVNNPDILHGKIVICFTPDEETGNGISEFDVSKLGADFGYTVDGGFTGEINRETFSADAAIIELTGVDMHPGYAKDKMVNSIRALAAIIEQLPQEMSPERTTDYEPYIHPVRIEGSVSKSRIQLILRDFTEEGLEKQRKLLETIVQKAEKDHPGTEIKLSISSTYRNMRDRLETVPHVTLRLENAVRNAGVAPIWKPIRGGTDGSKLTALGLPTPNIFTGACNAHSLTEWQSVDALVKVVETLINIVRADQQ